MSTRDIKDGVVDIDNSPGLVRDISNRAVINTDSSGLARARAIKKMFIDKELEIQATKEKVDALSAEIQEVKESVNQIKDLLVNFLNRDKG